MDDARPLSELRILARGGLVSFVGNIVTSLLGFLFVVLVGRTLSVPEAGGLFEAITIFTMISYGTVLGSDWGLLKIMPSLRTSGERRFLSSSALLPAGAATTAIAVVVFYYAPSIARVVTHHGDAITTGHELRVLAPFLPLSTVTTISLAGIRVWSVERSTAVSLIVPIARPVLMGVFIGLGFTPLLGALAFATPFAVAVFVGVAALFGRLNLPLQGETSDLELHKSRTKRKHIFREFWKFSGYRSMGGFIAIFLVSFDIVLLGILGSSRQVAAYTVASRYILMGTFALTSVGTAIAPQFGRLLVAGKDQAVRSLYRESTWWTMAVSWPVLIVMGLFAPLLMSLVNRSYATGAEALEILAIGMLFNTGTGSNGTALLMAGRSTTILVIDGTALAINVAANIALIPRYGLTGAAVAWSASIVFTAIACSLVLYRVANVQPFGSGYGAVAVSSLTSYGALGLVLRVALGPTWTSIGIVAAAGSAIYAGSLALAFKKKWLDVDGMRLLSAADR